MIERLRKVRHWSSTIRSKPASERAFLCLYKTQLRLTAAHIPWSHLSTWIDFSG